MASYYSHFAVPRTRTEYIRLQTAATILRFPFHTLNEGPEQRTIAVGSMTASGNLEFQTCYIWQSGFHGSTNTWPRFV